MPNLKDYATGTVATAPSPKTSGTTLNLQTGEAARMPAVPFYATAHPDYQLPTLDNSEKILVTAKNTTTNQITFVRAQGDATAKSIDVGWRISNAVFAADLFNTSLIMGETPGGLINSSNTAYTVAAAFSPGSLRVYLNGQRLVAGGSNDYTEAANGTGFTMNYAPQTGDVLVVDYNVGNTAISYGVNSLRSDETPTGSVNGSNTAFTTQYPYVAGTLEVFINGLKQARTTNVTETSPTAGTFSLDVAPATGDIVRVNYQYGNTAGGNSATLNGYQANDLTPIGVMQPYAGRAAPNLWLLCYGQAISRTLFPQLFQTLVPLIGNPTISIATPGVVSLANHGFITGDQIFFTTTGALPTGLTANTLYYVISTGTGTFTVATSRANAIAGTAVATSGTQSGTHSLYSCDYGLGDGSTTFNVPDARGRVLAGADAMGGTAASRLTLAQSQGAYGNRGSAGGEQGHVQALGELAVHSHTLGEYTSGNEASGYGLTATTSFQNRVMINQTNATSTGNAGSSTAANVVQPTLVTNYIIKAL